MRSVLTNGLPFIVLLGGDPTGANVERLEPAQFPNRTTMQTVTIVVTAALILFDASCHDYE